jgi:acid stress-induced BolA-like protein IbaG/YrbA
MMFGSVSEYFINLQQVKRRKTCVSVLNALFQGTEVVKHPFYFIGPKMMFGSVSEHFTNLQQVKRCKTCVCGLNALFRGTEVDADMATMLMSMRGAWIGEDGVQHGFPSQEGGPRLIWFKSRRWRPKAI